VVNSTLLFVLGVVLLLVGVGASIAIHELGHLYPAKKFGVLVTKYMIGFGPTIKSWQRGETEYGFKLIPLGGYIAMVGMFPSKTEGTDGTQSKIRGPKFWRDLVAQAREVNLEQSGSIPKNRWFTSLPIFKRLIIMFGGPFMNLVFGSVLLFVGLGVVGVPALGTSIAKVYDCVPSDQVNFECASNDQISPAKTAGLLPGDRVVSFNGVKASAWKDITAELANRVGQTSTLEIVRDTKPLTLSIAPVGMTVPVYDQNGKPALDAAGRPVTQVRPFIGVQLKPEMQPMSGTQVVSEIGNQLSGVSSMIVGLPAEFAQMASATFGIGERNTAGPVSLLGVGQIAGQVASSDQLNLSEKVSAGLTILASLNFALFIFNLIPLLPLDGGHMAAALFESVKRVVFKLRRKAWTGAVDLTKIVPLTYAMWFVLMGMSLLFIVADIVKPLA
jgi:membrane-associated protease RseP (regulator of RpoE activity)